MSFEERDNSGALFKNVRKEQPNHPDYRGPCTVNGVKMEMSAWVKTAKSGTKYMSFSFRPAEPRGNQRQDNDNWGNDGQDGWN